MLKIAVPVLALAVAAAVFPWDAGVAGTPARPAAAIQEMIDAAAAGDTVVIDGGVYEGNLTIDKPLTLRGQGGPVIDGGGQGDVITITADEVRLSGFTITGSGKAISQEPAAIKVLDTHAIEITGNDIRDSHFGIHVTGSHHATIANNTIEAGQGTPQERRGHAIYFWQVDQSLVHSNTIRYAADGIHLEFSDSNAIGNNEVRESRYALHFMYANGNKITGNVFKDNLAGAVIMFSQIVVLTDNEISGNRTGATGAGILLKDVDDIFAQDNRILRNKYGMTADGTPQTVGTTAVFFNNLFALNDTGLGLMSNAPITFVENAMIENTVQVKAMGGALASSLLSGHGGAIPGGGQGDQPPVAPSGIVWTDNGRGNYWSDYTGYDRNSDGVGDVPYAPQPPFAGGLADNDTLRLFQFTLAQEAIDMAARMFPLYRYDAVMEDSGPLMSPPGPVLPSESGINGDLLLVSGALLAISGLVLAMILDVSPGRLLDAIPRRQRERRA